MATSALLIAAIATVDWRTKPYVSLGFLYLFPIMLASGFLSRLQIAGLSVFCAILLEVFSSLPAADDVTRTVMVTIAFAGTGLFVWADRYGLLQVFINIARNSKRAMELVEDKQLTVTASMEGASVLIRFEDTGKGVSAPNNLFRPFQKGADATGLGLYVSRAIVRAFRGDLRYEPRPIGSCFTVELTPMPHCETT